MATPPRGRGRPRTREQPDEQNADANVARDFFAQMREFMQQQQQPPAPAQNNQEQNPRPRPMMEQFRRFQPPRFNGRGGPTVVEEWIVELERIFEHMELTETP